MHSTNHCFRPALVLVLSLLVAAPLAAQQAPAPRPTVQQQQPGARRTPPATQPRTAAAAPRGAAAQAPAPQAGQAGAPKAGAPAGQYPVRRTAATDPRAPAPAGAPGTASAPIQTTPAPAVPFTLTQEQERLLDVILQNWEKRSDKINTYTCTFGRWEINETFGPKENGYVLTEGEGDIKFKAPDNGTYIVSKLTEWDSNKKAYSARVEGLDHWVCDGKSIFEFNHEKKELIERQLAPEMRGKAITDGPLPFVFGAKADKLKSRYWIRDVTQPDEVGKTISLEAWPKYARDAANYQYAIIMLDHDFLPSALRIVLPDGKSKQDYAFSNTQVNNPYSILVTAFAAPRTPFGWKKVVIPAGGPDTVPPGDAPAAAALPPAMPKR
jgi:TIGR03009 family protein